MLGLGTTWGSGGGLREVRLRVWMEVGGPRTGLGGVCGPRGL